MNNRFIYAYYLYKGSKRNLSPELLAQELKDQAFETVRFHRSIIDSDLREQPEPLHFYKAAYEANQSQLENFASSHPVVAEPVDSNQAAVAPDFKQDQKQQPAIIIENKDAARVSGLQAYVGIFEIRPLESKELEALRKRREVIQKAKFKRLKEQAKQDPKRLAERLAEIKAMEAKEQAKAEDEVNKEIHKQLQDEIHQKLNNWLLFKLEESFVEERERWINEEIENNPELRKLKGKELEDARKRKHEEYLKKGLDKTWKDNERSLEGRLQDILDAQQSELTAVHLDENLVHDHFKYIRLAGILNWTTNGFASDARNRRMYLFPSEQVKKELGPLNNIQNIVDQRPLIQFYINQFVTQLGLNAFLAYSPFDSGEALLHQKIGSYLVCDEQLVVCKDLVFTQNKHEGEESLFELANNAVQKKPKSLIQHLDTNAEASAPVEEASASAPADSKEAQDPTGDTAQAELDDTVIDTNGSVDEESEKMESKEQQVSIEQNEKSPIIPKPTFYLMHSIVNLSPQVTLDKVARNERSKNGKIPFFLEQLEYQKMGEKFYLQKTMSLAQMQGKEYCIVTHVLDENARKQVGQFLQQDHPDDKDENAISYCLPHETHLLTVYHPKTQTLLINSNELDRRLEALDVMRESAHIALRQSGDRFETHAALQGTLQESFIKVPKTLEPDPEPVKKSEALSANDNKAAMVVSNNRVNANQTAPKLSGDARTVHLTLDLPPVTLQKLPPFERVSDLAQDNKEAKDKQPQIVKATKEETLNFVMPIPTLAVQGELSRRVEPFLANLDPKIDNRRIYLTLRSQVAAHPADEDSVLIAAELTQFSSYEKRQHFIVVVDNTIASSVVMDSLKKAFAITAWQNPSTQVSIIRQGSFVEVEIEKDHPKKSSIALPVGSRQKSKQLNEVLDKCLEKVKPGFFDDGLHNTFEKVKQLNKRKPGEPAVLTKVLFLVSAASLSSFLSGRGTFTQSIADQLKNNLGDDCNTQVFLRVVKDQSSLQRNHGLKPEQIVESLDELAEQTEAAIISMGKDINLVIKVRNDENQMTLYQTQIDLANLAFGETQPIILFPRINNTQKLNVTFTTNVKTEEGISSQLYLVEVAKDAKGTSNEARPVTSVGLTFSIADPQPNLDLTVSYYRKELEDILQIAEKEKTNKANKVKEFIGRIKQVFPERTKAGPRPQPITKYIEELQKLQRKLQKETMTSAKVLTALVLDVPEEGASQQLDEQPGANTQLKSQLNEGPSASQPHRPRYCKRAFYPKGRNVQPGAPELSPREGQPRPQ